MSAHTDAIKSLHTFRDVIDALAAPMTGQVIKAPAIASIAWSPRWQPR